VSQQPPPWSPPGSDAILGYARSRRLLYELRPDERWFRHWEPHDTMVAPELWLNVCTERSPYGTFVVAEPWTAGEGLMPIERAVVGFAQVPTLYGGRGGSRRAAMRVGEPFLTKVAYLEAPPPPKVTLDDPVWDAHVTTFAASPSEALAAFPRSLRDMLRHRGFRGHLEIRPGGFVVHHEGLVPRPSDYDLTFRMLHDIARTLASA